MSTFNSSSNVLQALLLYSLNQRDQVSAQICSADTGVAGRNTGAKGRKRRECRWGGEIAKGMPLHPFLRYLSEAGLLELLYAGYANFYATVRARQEIS